MWTNVWLCSLMFAFSAGKIAHYDPKRCGRPSTYTSFVITDDEGNTGNPTYSAPWAVQIRVNSGGGDFAVICGGTLITEKHVLTAAHCFQKKFGGEKTGKPSDKMPGRYCDANGRYTDSEILQRTHVTVGAMCTKKEPKYQCVHENQNGKTVKIKRFAMGDFFTNNCEKGNDIVIMELESSILGLEGANYACLPFLPAVPLSDGINVTSFGWGSDPGKGYDHSIFPMIQQLELAVDSLETCKENWGTKIPHDSFCTVEEEDKNVCSGDSGGGLTFVQPESTRQYIIAIVSYGSDCVQLIGGSEPKSQINTDIRKHKDFILKFINSK